MTKEQAKHMSWCLDNNIYIYPIVWKEWEKHQPPRVAIQVDYQGFKRTGDIIWKQKTQEDKEKIAKKILDLYEFYYISKNKKDNP